MRTVGVSNQKGGVAKTTNTINIAGALASLGASVCVVDSDPQGYLTNRLGLGDEYKAPEPTFYDLWLSPHEYDPAEFIVAHDEFDVLPSSIDMFHLEQELTAAGWRVRKRLDMILDNIPQEYDVVLVDAPPSLGPINDNVLLGTGEIIIPMEDAEESVLALDHLFTQIESLEGKFGEQISELAVVISNVEYPLDNEQEDVIEWINDKFGGVCPVYEIRNRVTISRALNDNGSVFGYDEACDQEAVYEELVNEVFL